MEMKNIEQKKYYGIKMKFYNLKFNTFLERYVNKTLVELNI